MKIAVLGGAFNPPHFGHELIAKKLSDSGQFDEVWLTPCYQHTFNKDLAPVYDRVSMTKLLTNKKIVFCDEEIKNKLNGQTIKLMTLLTKKYPQHQFVFVVGSDNLKSFKKWAHWQKLILNFTFLVFPRPEFKYNLKKYGLDNPGYKFILLKQPLLAISDISSTRIRERLSKGLSIDRLVPDKVKQYIYKHHLYEQ